MTDIRSSLDKINGELSNVFNMLHLQGSPVPGSQRVNDGYATPLPPQHGYITPTPYGMVTPQPNGIL